MIEHGLIAGIDYYLENGLMVFTAQYLRDRGYCLHVGLSPLSLRFRAPRPGEDDHRTQVICASMKRHRVRFLSAI